MADDRSYVRDFTPPAMAESYSNSPRFGHSSDITDLAGDNSSDYLMGLAMAALIVTICFAVALLVIPIFMCCGKHRVGFLSGKPFESHNHHKAKYVRGTFIGCGLLFLIFAILLVTQGITQLQDTVVVVHTSAVDVGAIAKEADKIVNLGLKDVRGMANSIRDKLIEELHGDELCPADPNFSNNQEFKEIRDLADEALDQLEQIDDLDQIDDIASSIDDVIQITSKVEDSTADLDVTDWEALLVLIPLTMIPCLLVALTILAHFDVLVPLWVVHFVLMPLLIVEVILCIVLASFALAGASANADFCLPPPSDVYALKSPDTTIFRLLDDQGYGTEEFAREVADYYLNQCAPHVADPYDFLREHLPSLDEAEASIKGLIKSFSEDGTLLAMSLYCNRDFVGLEALLASMETVIDVLLEAISRTIDLTSCARIVPIYHRAFYDGACNYSLSALMWIFSSSIILSITGLVMILLRSAVKPNKFDEDERLQTMAPEQNPEVFTKASLY